MNFKGSKRNLVTHNLPQARDLLSELVGHPISKATAKTEREKKMGGGEEEEGEGEGEGEGAHTLTVYTCIHVTQTYPQQIQDK